MPDTEVFNRAGKEKTETACRLELRRIVYREFYDEY
jgi:hypothetical protein